MGRMDRAETTKGYLNDRVQTFSERLRMINEYDKKFRDKIASEFEDQPYFKDGTF